ncbi:MAG: hypothetical protein H0T88_04400 [Lysobacter sp.]|nr:hypothetical protein [Lysobacter sp.]
MSTVNEVALFIDASVFLGMHHRDEMTRNSSLSFFQSHFKSHRVRMNYEQIGICDAVIWQQSREAQDIYYPFMDLLHSEMKIHRVGYTFNEIKWWVEQPALCELLPEQALLVAQVVLQGGCLMTHDPILRKLPVLTSRLWDVNHSYLASSFPPELQALYEASRFFVHDKMELRHA